MPPIKMSWEMNINTLLTIGSFGVMMATGYGAYTSFKAETEAWRKETAAQITEIKVQTASDVARMESRAGADVTRMELRAAALESSVNNLNIQDARQIEHIASMLVYLQRIEGTLDALVKSEKQKP